MAKRVYRCRDCGSTMERRGFPFSEFQCPQCGLGAELDMFGNMVFDGEDEVASFGWDEEEEKESRSPACAACGNPAYPDCKTSCALYDD